MTVQEFNDIMNDLIDFGKDLGLSIESRTISKIICCEFWHPDINLNLLRFTTHEIDGKIFDLKISLFPIRKLRSIYLDDSKLKTFNFKKYMKAYLLTYKYLKMKLEKQKLDEEFEV